MTPELPVVFDPKDIVEKCHHQNYDENQTVHVSDTKHQHTTGVTSHMSLAQEAIVHHRAKCVGNGAWMVMEPNGITHHAVRIQKRLALAIPQKHATT